MLFGAMRILLRRSWPRAKENTITKGATWSSPTATPPAAIAVRPKTSTAAQANATTANAIKTANRNNKSNNSTAKARGHRCQRSTANHPNAVHATNDNVAKSAKSTG